MKDFYNPYRSRELDEEKKRKKEAEKQDREKEKQDREKNKQEKEEERYKKNKDYKYLEESLSAEDKQYSKGIHDKIFSAGLDQIVWSEIKDYAQINLLEILIKQNWMIIKQLNEINNKLDK